VETQAFPLSKLGLQQVKLLRINDGLVAFFDVVLLNLALVARLLFVEKVHSKALLRRAAPLYFPFVRMEATVVVR